MNLKQLRAKKAQLELDARAKLAEVKDDTVAADATRIDGEHKSILEEITVIELRMKKAEDEAARANVDDQDDAPSNDGDDNDDEEDAKKSRSRALLTRSQMAELALIDSQARSLGIADLDLPDAITRNEKPDEMRKRMFEALAKKSSGTKVSGVTGVEVVRDEQEGRSAAFEIALTTRILSARGRSGIEYKGPKAGATPETLAARKQYEAHRAQAESYLGMGIVDIAAACIDYRPTNGRGYLTGTDTTKIFERAFSTTSDFPNIFQNALNKALLARYDLHMPTYRQLAAERPFKDFRPHPQIRAGDFPALQPVLESGELAYGTTQDNGETASVTPYGVVFTISRQMLVNDDLGAIDQLLGSAGDTVLVFENNTFFAMFNSNTLLGPTLLQDGLTVFQAATHANYTSSGTAPSITSLGVGRALLRKMTSLSGLFLNVPPSMIVCGPQQETLIDQLVTTITPLQFSNVNPFSGKLAPVVDANITDLSWYLMADPGRVPVFIYGFLNGASGPRVRTFEPFGVQGVKISLEHDFGVGAIDYRGAYRNAGA